MNDDVTPLGAIGRGLAAGFVGTAAMTVWQLLAARLQSSGGEPGNPSPEPKDPWEEASAPVIALDLSYHLVYGSGVATTYRLLP